MGKSRGEKKAARRKSQEPEFMRVARRWREKDEEISKTHREPWALHMLQEYGYCLSDARRILVSMDKELETPTVEGSNAFLEYIKACTTGTREGLHQVIDWFHADEGGVSGTYTDEEFAKLVSYQNIVAFLDEETLKNGADRAESYELDKADIYADKHLARSVLDLWKVIRWSIKNYDRTLSTALSGRWEEFCAFARKDT